MTTETQEKLPDTELEAKVHAAMEASKGDFVEAGKLVGMTRSEIKSFCWRSASLKQRWWNMQPTAPPPDDIDSIVRQPISPEDERMAWTMERESERFKGGLERCGLLSPAQVQTAKELQILNNSHMSSLLDVANASLVALVLLLVTEAKTIESRLAGVRKILDEMSGEISEERMAKVEEEKALCQSLNNTCDTVRKIQVATNQSAMNLAIIKYRLRNGANAKKAKPGFSPIDVNPTTQ